MIKNKCNKSISTDYNSIPSSPAKEKPFHKYITLSKYPKLFNPCNIFDSRNKNNINNRYYYKNPQFLNNSSIQNQIDILLTNINNEKLITKSLKAIPKITINSDIDENPNQNFNFRNVNNNIRRSYNSLDNNKDNNKNKKIRLPKISLSPYSFMKNRYLNNECKNNWNKKINEFDYIYKNIFPNSPLFKTKTKIIDNKLNIVYCQNESQYKYLLEKKSRFQNNQRSNIFKLEEDSDKIKGQVDDIKTKITFMKNVMDYSYPDFMLTKIKVWGKNFINKQNDCQLTPVEEQIKLTNKRNLLRTKYLKQDLSILPLKIE